MSLRAAAHYTNLTLVRPKRPSAAARKAEADSERHAESRVKHKVEQTHRVLNTLEARAKQFALQIKALQRRKQATEARAERIENRALQELSDAGLPQVAGLRVTLIARPSGNPTLMVDDEKLIPKKYFRETLVTTVDKLAIKAALDRDEEVGGVHLVQSVSLVRK
jgi:hypothetical protein